VKKTMHPALHFIVYTPSHADGLMLQPGALHYNCLVAAQRFLPLLHGIGAISEVHGAGEEIEPRIQTAIQRGELPLLIAFAPPHLLPDSKHCPMIAFFAWAYDTIPVESWGNNPRNDWRYDLQTCAGVVTHSRYALHAIDAATRSAVPAISIPVPVPTAFFELFDAAGTPATGSNWELQFDGVVIDSHALGLDHDVRGSEISYVPAPCKVRLPGIVYCLVVDPIDNSKNWLDSLLAFGFAFHDNADVALIIKLSHYDTARICELLHYEMRKMAPYRCRIVAIATWLDAQQFEQLVKNSTYVINSARAETQGLTLLEFMAAGKPAITPQHTALADYIDDDAAFIVASSREWIHWPHDPRMMLRAHRYRIDWSSYHDALVNSYAVATQDMQRYSVMSLCAHNAALRHCAPVSTAQPLRNYMDAVVQGLMADDAWSALRAQYSRSLKRSIKTLMKQAVVRWWPRQKP